MSAIVAATKLEAYANNDFAAQIPNETAGFLSDHVVLVVQMRGQCCGCFPGRV